MTEPPDTPDTPPRHLQPVPDDAVAAAEQPTSAGLDHHNWDRPWKGRFLEAYARLPVITSACKAAGISRPQLYRVIRENTDPEFSAAFQQARDVAVDLLEQIAHRRATIGEEQRIVRTVTKRETNARGEMVVVEETTMTETRMVISNSILWNLLKAYRPKTYGDKVGVNVGPWADDQPAPPGSDEPDVDPIFRRRTREQVAALAEIAVELGVVEGTARELPPRELESGAPEPDPHRNGDT